ncbi:MAG: hypothetical protein NZ455_10910, partial [Bacteroidia bacterium]|nr:hypothetical protein [Bacteroidia bacterium]
AHTFTLDQGVGGWGAAPLARSTPTLPTRAQQAVGKDTPKKAPKLNHYKTTRKKAHFNVHFTFCLSLQLCLCLPFY